MTTAGNIGTFQTTNPPVPIQGGQNHLPSMYFFFDTAKKYEDSDSAGTAPSKLPRAILPPQRTFWGAILDVIVGDGPSKRYGFHPSFFVLIKDDRVDVSFPFYSLICDERLHERWKFRFR